MKFCRQVNLITNHASHGFLICERTKLGFQFCMLLLLYRTLVKDNMLIGCYGYWLNLFQHSHIVDAQVSKVTNRILGFSTAQSTIIVVTVIFYAVSSCQTLSENKCQILIMLHFAEFSCVCTHVITSHR